MAKPLLLVVLALMLGAATIFGMSLKAESPMENTFDAAIWTDKEAIYEVPPPRLAMVEDVMANHLKAGMSREAVVALLGPPTETPYFADRGMVYWLGNEQKTISVDSAWLAIDFDSSGKVSAFEIVTD